MKDRESVIEIGFGLFVALLIAAAAIMLGGRSAGGAKRKSKASQGPPARGSVPVDRHFARGAVSSR